MPRKPSAIASTVSLPSSMLPAAAKFSPVVWPRQVSDSSPVWAAAPPVHHGELALGGHGVTFDQKVLHFFGSLVLGQEVEAP